MGQRALTSKYVCHVFNMYDTHTDIQMYERKIEAAMTAINHGSHCLCLTHSQ